MKILLMVPVKIIHLRWLTDERIMMVFILLQVIMATVDMAEDITIILKVILLFWLSDMIYKGAAFWMVKRIRSEFHFIVDPI